MKVDRPDAKVRTIRGLHSLARCSALLRCALRRRSARRAKEPADIAKAFPPKAKVRLLNVWATWCIPCVAEMPDLRAIDEAFGDELAIAGVSMDDMIPDTKPAKVAAFLDKQRIAFPNVYYTGNPDDARRAPRVRRRDPAHDRLRPQRQRAVAPSGAPRTRRNDRAAARHLEEDAMKKLGVIALMLIAGMACAQEQLAVGAKAPAFSLVNAVDGETVAMKPDDGRVKVVVFTCNQCPYAKAFEPRIIELANKFAQKGVKFYAVNPNDDAKFAEETLANMKARAEEKEYPLPVPQGRRQQHRPRVRRARDAARVRRRRHRASCAIAATSTTPRSRRSGRRPACRTRWARC